MPHQGQPSGVRQKYCHAAHQILLVSLMLALEANLGMVLLTMVVNIQALGIPVGWIAIPSLLSALLGIIMIPSISFVIQRWAKSRLSKGIILLFVTMILVLGSGLVLVANLIKLYSADNNLNQTNSHMYYTTAEPIIHMSTSLSGNESSFSSSEMSTFSDYSISENLTIHGKADVGFHGLSVDSNEEGVPYFAIMAMVGYALTDSGYDIANCFLKIFALSATSTRDASTIMVKIMLAASFGGALIAVLGSFGLGDTITAGSSYDSNAATSIFFTSTCVVLLMLCLALTLGTGLGCPPIKYTDSDDTKTFENNLETKSETTRLLRTSSHDLTASQKAWKLTESVGSTRSYLDKTRTVRTLLESHTSETIPTDTGEVSIAEPAASSGKSRFQRRLNLALICLYMFLNVGCMYSCQMFGANFLGIAIFNGDPSAPAGSEQYKDFLRGVDVASTVYAFYYIAVLVASCFHEYFLQKIGWKMEVIVTGGVQSVLLLILILSRRLEVYYVMTVWSGTLRSVLTSVPYILATQLSTGQEGEGDSTSALSTVAAMIPIGFTMSSIIVSPLVDATKDAAVPMYYSFLTCVVATIALGTLRM